MKTTAQANEVLLSNAEKDDLAAAASLIAVLVPLIQMLLLSVWLAFFVLHFRLVEYGRRKGKLQFTIAQFHALTSPAGAFISFFKELRTKEKLVAERYWFEPVDQESIDQNSKKCLILVPGTWDTASGVPDYFSPLLDRVRATGARVALLVFKWPSTNDFKVRERAASALASQLLIRSVRVPGSAAVLVGYSHGGTVAMRAAGIVGSAIASAVITAGTPRVAGRHESPATSLHEKHLRSAQDPVVAQLEVSHSARRRQFALTRLLKMKLNASVNLGVWRAVRRGSFVLFCLGVSPSFILLGLALARRLRPEIIPAGLGLHELAWVLYVVSGTIFVLAFDNPAVSVVYRLLRQGLFQLLFAANSPVFAILFGVSLTDVMSYRFRLSEPRPETRKTTSSPSVWTAHEDVLSSEEMIQATLEALDAVP